MTVRPRWAASIWYDSDHIHIEMTTIDGYSKHSVKVPYNAQGLLKVLTLIKARDADSKLGSKGEPTQAQINKPTYHESMVRKVDKFRGTPEQEAKAREILRQMGMI